MTNPARELAKLVPRTMSTQPLPPGGGRPEVEPCHVAAALSYGHISREAYLIGRVAWLRDLSVLSEDADGISELERLLLLRLPDAVREVKNWEPKKGRLRAMLRLAVIEVALGCMAGKITDKRRAEWCDVSVSQWCRVWGARYERVYQWVNGLASVALQAVRQGMDG